jgi:hypothetical protein
MGMAGRRRLHRPLLRAVASAVATYGVSLLLTRDAAPWAPGWILAGLAYTQLFEYFLHRVPMHHGLAGLEFIRRQHLAHHRIFAGERLQSRDPQDLRFVATAWYTFPLLFALHYAVFVLAFPQGLAPAFFLGVTLHFIAYEALHWLTHVEDNAFDRFVARIPVLGAVREHQIRHHQLHHAVPVVNFNFTPPYGGDLCAGTRSRRATGRLVFAAALAFALTSSGDAQTPPPAESPAALIERLKDFQGQLGFEPTGNFRTASQTVASYYRCYYTGPLELPDSYDDLKLKYGDQAGCAVDSAKHDVFFYPVEAVANGTSPVTTSLAQSSVERLLMVVPHEDFHHHDEAQAWPSSISEAASTLIGFLTAAGFARQNFGEDSAVSKNLAGDADLFRRKAAVVNQYYGQLAALYADVRSHALLPEAALARKQVLFARLREECLAVAPDPSSFNKCLGADNNAGLAFDFTYTKHYPLMYEIYEAHGRDLKATVSALRRTLAGKPRREPQAVELFRGLIEEGRRRRQ